jgi:hypothetical protein
VYRLDDLKRVIWFPLTEDGHNGNQFIVSVALDQNNQPWQLTLDRCRGINHDELILVRARRLGGLKAHRFNWVPGSRVG